MFARLARLCRSTKTAPAAPAPARSSSMYEPLEDRRLCSVSPASVSSFSWGATNTGSYGLLLPAVQASRATTTAITDGTSNTLLPAVQSGGTTTNITGVLIAL